jgi:hypothetical protein
MWHGRRILPIWRGGVKNLKCYLPVTRLTHLAAQVGPANQMAIPEVLPRRERAEQRDERGKLKKSSTKEKQT